MKLKSEVGPKEEALKGEHIGPPAIAQSARLADHVVLCCLGKHSVLISPKAFAADRTTITKSYSVTGTLRPQPAVAKRGNAR